MDGERCLLDLGAESGGAAEMCEVGGEAVAEIDAGGREVAAQEGFADVEARLGEEVGMVVAGLCAGEAISSEHAG